MRRRDFITLLGAAMAWPLAARAQQIGKIPRIGYLGPSSPALERHLVDAFREKLRELGHVEGENIAIEYRWAEGRDDRLPGLAAELASLQPDVIVTTGTPGTLAAKAATSTIPIVFASSGNPISGGLVASYARPGGKRHWIRHFGGIGAGRQTSADFARGGSRALPRRPALEPGQSRAHRISSKHPGGRRGHGLGAPDRGSSAGR